MVKLHTALLLVILGIVASSISPASEDNWRISLRADNALGGGFGFDAQLGVYPLSADGVDRGQDSPAYYFLDFPMQCRWIVSRIPGDSGTWIRDIRAPGSPASYPGLTRTWELRIAGMPNTADDPIRLFLRTLTEGSLSPARVGGVDVAYRLVMADNRGVPDAPANGRVWDLPIPTAHAAEPYWYLPQADWLPMLRVSWPTHEAMIAEGYVMLFEQYAVPAPTAVPEPAGLLSLGIGIAGIAGSSLRRRRA